MARPCDRPGCGVVAEVSVRWVSNAEEAHATRMREEDREVSVAVSMFVGCRDHAREVWRDLRGSLRHFREI